MSTCSVRVVVFCACALLIQQASAELKGRCPVKDAACPARASPCSKDDECGEQVCCQTTCGQACVDPMFTGCENLKLSSERISRALAAENSRSGRGLLRSVRAPRCRATDGEFEEIQCDNEIVSSCWCVDATGFEVPGTRAPAAGLVNCTQAAPCAAHTCRMLCPLGFELDSKGCPLCKCRDPCSSVTCPGQLSCQLEETPCLKPPCPPVPTCKRGRSLQNICPAGEPLLISETSRPFLCGTDPGKPNCPPLYKCLVESGNDYGVCCPASLELRKAGTCPASFSLAELDCGTPCAHDLECPSMQKCCDGGECGKHCVLPNNVTMCTQQKMLAELLVISEKEGRGYVPQCAVDGSFVSKQCSRNGLVCWCVDTEGNKLRGSMGPSATVRCSKTLHTARSGARSLDRCARALCAGVCEYGYKTGSDGCPTCECDDPCEGFPCADGEECVRVKDSECSGDLCTGYPVCRPRVSYENPCEVGWPASDDEGTLIECKSEANCPSEHLCMKARRGMAAVCCPDPQFAYNNTESEALELNFNSCGAEAEALCGLNSTTCPEGTCDDGLVCCSTSTCGPLCVDSGKMRLQSDRVDYPPTMCEYLRDFDEKMEGTVDGMKLALPAPKCLPDGAFAPRQCAAGRCWCVDSFGTEIPETSTNNASTVDCERVRSEIACLDLTCRLGCDYGFELGTNRCPTCRCRDACTGVTCPAGRACAVVDVACDAEYCPPVPACLPRKPGQCPYLVPSTGSCEWSCKTDAECGATERCCATGCGTACTTAVHQSACEQRKALALHTAAESGSPPAWTWVPNCKEDGSFERVQCKGFYKTCWCVDVVGDEIPGTRVTNSTPTCDSPAKCPELPCSKQLTCPHGRVLDDKGCPTCDCRDLCAEAKCRADESCELVPMECDGEPCLPLTRCAPSPLCPGGSEPLKVPDGSSSLTCGPNAAACPSTHACRFAPHDSRPAVCCLKPRTVCFENKDEGVCIGRDVLNATRWHFNHERNRCERFKYHGCSGNHNNFRTKEECKSVCPVKDGTVNLIIEVKQSPDEEVLSPCERLREKNEIAAQKYGKGTFIPLCDETGAWESVQCMSHINVCWCVNARGEPLKGSLVRGGKPNCNFRQARKWVQRDPLDERDRANEVLEELIRQMTAYKEEYNDNEDLNIDELDQIASAKELPESDAVLGIEVVEPKYVEAIMKAEEEPLEGVEKIQTKCQSLQEDVENGKLCNKQVESIKKVEEKPLEVFEKIQTKCQSLQEDMENGKLCNKQVDDTKKAEEKPLEVVEEIQTKCQSLQEDVENGKLCNEQVDDTNKAEEKPLEVVEEIQTKCQSLQEDVENGKLCNEQVDAVEKAEEKPLEVVEQIQTKCQSLQEDVENGKLCNEQVDALKKAEEKILEIVEKIKTKCQSLQEDVENGGEGLRPRCLPDGSFAPRQCNRGRCRCVDAAGQRVPYAGVVLDYPNRDPCEQTYVESALLELELFGIDDSRANAARDVLSSKLASLGARVPVTLTKNKTTVKLRAQLLGSRAADIVYHVENLVKQDKISALNMESEAGVLDADVIRSEYRLASPAPAFHQREILTESTVSAATSYHTALIVLAATSAFIISVLCVLVMLYRARLQREPHKAERFLPPAPPVYVLSADEKAELARILRAPPAPVPPQEAENTRI